MADVLSRNPVESIIGEKVQCAIIRDLVLSSRDQLIEEQRTDPELGLIYRYLENPEDSSVNAIISNIFENLRERLGIRHVKTVVYRPQANRTERVNRDLVQMIANYVNEQHDTWDKFLREFAYAIRTAVKETTGKTPAELFLGQKLIAPFQKLVMVLDGTEFAVEDIERLFEEARRNTKANMKNGRNIIIGTGVICKLRKRGRTEETVAASTSIYNLRPRGDRKVESRPAMERKTQQGGPVRSRKSSGMNDSPYIEKRTRSGNWNARRRGDQQEEDQERKGASTSRSISLEVLVGDANYKS
ncbi:uncharacterized protein TNCV_3798351 [Trichonephila clavipes]|nr:uncharacterized protein TNCV_3798351 [Trichonephila clavipes]